MDVPRTAGEVPTGLASRRKPRPYEGDRAAEGDGPYDENPSVPVGAACGRPPPPPPAGEVAASLRADGRGAAPAARRHGHMTNSGRGQAPPLRCKLPPVGEAGRPPDMAGLRTAGEQSSPLRSAFSTNPAPAA